MVHGQLKKYFGFFGIFSIAAGAMISSGLFVLPAVVFPKVGPGLSFSYLLAGFLMIPALLSQAELATAMPKTGGAYFFVSRSLGPLIGTFAGFANWFSISLKGAFALIGTGAFVQLVYPAISPLEIKLIALGLLLIFFILNMAGTQESNIAQILMVAFLLAILIFYILTGAPGVRLSRYRPFLPQGMGGVIAVTGMVFISYGGLTQVGALAGETLKPGRNIPAGMIASFVVVTVLYVLSTLVTVGLLPAEDLVASYTPLSSAAAITTGLPGVVLLTIGAILAFTTTAHAGLLAASRMLLAMSYDHMIPQLFQRMRKGKDIPRNALIFTAVFMAAIILALEIEVLVTVASTVMLILYFFINLSVIIMRESRIVTYKPAFKSPLYPGIQIAGMILYLAFIITLGLLPILLTVVFSALSVLWYLGYCRNRMFLDSAFMRIIEKRMGKDFGENGLHAELKEILIERDNIVEDEFDQLVKEAAVIDLNLPVCREDLFRRISPVFAEKTGLTEEDIVSRFLEREKTATTVLYTSLAIPHIFVEGIERPILCIVRDLKGVSFQEGCGEDSYPGTPLVTMIFAIAGVKENRHLHLETLMAIGQIVQEPSFQRGWIAAGSEEELRSLILTTERKRQK